VRVIAITPSKCCYHSHNERHSHVYQLPVPPDQTDLTKALVTISYEDTSLEVFAHRFEGGQRLLLSDETCLQLIDMLSRDQSFQIQVGGYCSYVIPENFQCQYDALLNH
jgi:hypothetical protein